ncbi:MAG TPA: hypothetical protein VF618_22275 [Thermoanaerobaculia bacterium]
MKLLKKRERTLALEFGRLVTVMTLATLTAVTWKPELSPALTTLDKPVAALVLLAFFYYLSPRGE